MRGGFTLIEALMTLVISSLLAVGAFRALEALYLRSARAKAITELSLQSQIVLDQLSALLYSRIPNTAIGYDPQQNECKALDEIVDGNYSVLEWLAFDEENLLQRRYDGFVDMAESARPDLQSLNDLSAPETYRLIFAGTFDRGESDAVACQGAYGWHGHDHNRSYAVDAFGDENITLEDSQLPTPMAIYEKYYLTKGAYAVTRSHEIDPDAQCIQDLNASIGGRLDANDSLLLFYGYRPALGQTFCADPNGSGQEGNVTLLANDVVAFHADTFRDSIRLRLEMSREIRGTNPVRVSKQKAVF